jgi:hypothetical protein
MSERQPMSVRMKYLREYYRANGMVSVVAQLMKSALGISNGKKHKRFLESLDGRDHTAVFSEIYRDNLWKGGKSRSGAGSELAYTENLRFFLPIVFERFGIQTIVDAPCGDFNWMRLVPLAKNMSYVGIDIVPQMISDNQKQYGDERRRFVVANIVNDPLPNADILICRDCLFHLSNTDIVLLLQNFINSNASFLLTNTHINHGSFVNTDIKAGDFRLIDLFSEPFCLPKNVHYRIEDFIHPHPPREMCLWDKVQIGSAVQEMSKKAGFQRGEKRSDTSDITVVQNRMGS